MTRVFAYDLARLFLGPLSQTPRGIDRVDLALARHFFADAATPNLGILPTPWGVRAYDAAMVRRGLDHLERLWAEQAEAAPESHLVALGARFEGRTPGVAPSLRPRLSTPDKIRRIFAELRSTGFSFGHAARNVVPQRAVYINVGQIGLAVPQFHFWLERRADITCAIMLHDAIPLEYPHLVDPGSVAHHARMIRTAQRHADCLIFTTEPARQSVFAAMHPTKGGRIASCVRSLPLPGAFAAPGPAYQPPAGHRYFVAVSAIEPRKNHELLIEVWRRLVVKWGKQAPHLVIVGARGWGSGRILAPLAEDPALRARVHVATGMPSPALARLMLGAAGVLCPSLAEGFGLPLLEGNALGVPTIASDIAAHREIANGQTRLLPTDDVPAWKAAIEAVLDAGDRPDCAIPASLTEAAYCRDIEAFLEKCASGNLAEPEATAPMTDTLPGGAPSLLHMPAGMER